MPEPPGVRKGSLRSVSGRPFPNPEKQAQAAGC